MLRENRKILIVTQQIIDIFIMFLSIVLAYNIRFYNYLGDYISIGFYLTGAVLLIPVYLWICNTLGLYKPFRTKKFVSESMLVVQTTFIFTTVILILLFMIKEIDISRKVIILFIFINISLSSLYRFLLRRGLKYIRGKGYNKKYILVQGDNDIVRELRRRLVSKSEFGYEVMRYRGEIDKLEAFFENNIIEEMFIDTAEENIDTIKKVYNACEKCGVKFNMIPNYARLFSNRLYVDEVDSIPVINIRQVPLESIWKRFVKRTMDIVISLLLIIVLFFPSVIIAIIIKWDSKGPIFYKQERMGLNKRKFYIYKFRSMSVSYSKEGNIEGDENIRCTPFGKFIRRWNLDEIPQFVNVFTGSMSLVGPRPEIPELVEKYKEEIPGYMIKHQVKCGMTGLAQIKGYTGRTSIKKRINYDMKYIENWTIWMDIKIILKTIPSIFSR